MWYSSTSSSHSCHFLFGKTNFLKCASLSFILILSCSVSINGNNATSEEDSFNSTENDSTDLPSSFLKLNPLNRIGTKLPMCTCGVKGRQDVKIVGGVLSKQHSWPWVAAIVAQSKKGKKVVCGSSMVGKKHLLTAAHCVNYIKQQGLSKFRVILGTNNINDKKATIRTISTAMGHPSFNSTSLDYDVGILELGSPVNFSQTILPVCLTPQNGVPYVGKSAIVAGWGSTYFGGSTTTMQMQVMLGVISNADCQALYRNETDITTRMMCASRSNKDSCQGDSGGSLFIQKEGTSDRYLQIGIVSFGKGCGDRRYPGIYGRVSRFTNWIMRKVGNDYGCNSSL